MIPGLLLISALVVCVFAAAVVMVLRLSAEPDPDPFGYLTYEPEDAEQPLADEVEAWLAREDFR